MGRKVIKMREKTYTKLKKYAQENEKAMTEVVADAVEEYLKTKREYEKALDYLVEKVKKGEL